MNVQAFYASRQLTRALKCFSRGEILAGIDAATRAHAAVERIVEESKENDDEPHAKACMCRSCHETMLEKL